MSGFSPIGPPLLVWLECRRSPAAWRHMRPRIACSCPHRHRMRRCTRKRIRLRHRCRCPERASRPGSRSALRSSGLPSAGENAGMTFIPGGTFTMGSDRHRPEERYTHVVQRRRLLDRSHRGHQCAVCQVRRGDRLRHPGRTRRRSEGPCQHAQAIPGTGLGGLHHADGREPRRQRHAMVPVHFRGRLAPSRRTQHLNCRPRKSSGGPRRLRGRAGLRALAGT